MRDARFLRLISLFSCTFSSLNSPKSLQYKSFKLIQQTLIKLIKPLAETAKRDGKR